MKALAKLIEGMKEMVQAGFNDTNLDTIQKVSLKMNNIVAASKTIDDEAGDLAYFALQVFTNHYIVEILDREVYGSDPIIIRKVRDSAANIFADMATLLKVLMSDNHNYKKISALYSALSCEVGFIMDYVHNNYTSNFVKVPSRIFTGYVSLMTSYQWIHECCCTRRHEADEKFAAERDEFNKQNPTAYGYQNLYGVYTYPGQDASDRLLGMFPYHETVGRSISELIYMLKDLHREFGGDFWKIEDQLRSTCIVADAYCSAVREWNNDGYEMIPASALVWDIIRLKIERFSKRGAVFNEEILAAIKPISE